MIQIDKGVPLPDARGGVGTKKYPFDALAVGDSFFVSSTDDEKQRTLTRLSTHYTRHRPKKFCGRKVNGGVRIWRIA